MSPENDEFARLGSVELTLLKVPSFMVSPLLNPGLPYEVSMVAVNVLSIFFFWRHNSARYVLSAFLVLGMSMFPYTGWIVGMFTTPFQLWRIDLVNAIWSGIRIFSMGMF